MLILCTEVYMDNYLPKKSKYHLVETTKNCTMTTAAINKSSSIQYLKTNCGDSIAYERIVGKPQYPSLVYVPGYGTGKDGEIAKFLKQVAEEGCFGFVSYDPVGLGESMNDKTFASMEFEDWLLNAEAVLNMLAGEKVILVGGSMGGWISVRLAAQHNLKPIIKGMILISTATNFGSLDYRAIPGRKSFFMNMKKFEMHGSLDIDVPVIILHGVKDEIIPFKESINIMENLTSKDVELIYVKEATHSFQDPQSLDILKDRVMKMVDKMKTEFKI